METVRYGLDLDVIVVRAGTGDRRSTTSRPHATTALPRAYPADRWCRTPIRISSGWATTGRGSAGTRATIFFGYALITPRQMLIANHYSPLMERRAEHPVRLASGQVTNATVQSQPGYHSYPPGGSSYASDMATAQFSSPIPQSAGVTTYSILFQGYNPSTYTGYNLLSYGYTARIGWNQIAVGRYGHDYLFGRPSQYSPDPAYYMNISTTRPPPTAPNSKAAIPAALRSSSPVRRGSCTWPGPTT